MTSISASHWVRKPRRASRQVRYQSQTAGSASRAKVRLARGTPWPRTSLPGEAAIYQPHSWQDDALPQPEVLTAFQRLLDQGWTDALRAIHPDGPLWTFWAYLRNRWPNDKGLQLDHLLLTPDLAEHLVDAGVDRWVRGQDEASDHAPTWIDLDFP